MFKLLASALVAITVSSHALASPSQTTTGVNLRAGPGTNFATLQILPAGAALDVNTCDDAGAWCAVTYKGEKGFVSGRYLQASKEQERWPRVYDIGQGRLVLHQPQFSAWTDFKNIEALVAAEYSKGPNAKPVFGVIGLRGKTAYNDEEDKVVISDVVVTELNFSSLGRDELDALTIGVGKLLPTGPLTIPGGADHRKSGRPEACRRHERTEGRPAAHPSLESACDPRADQRRTGLCTGEGQGRFLVRGQHELGPLADRCGRRPLPAG